MGTSLVTGGRGFVGGWLAKALLERGERVVSFDRRRTTEKPSAVGMLGIEDDLVQVEGDLVDGAELASNLARERVDTVYHLAAETIVATVQASPVAGFESNVRGTWTLLQACLEHGVDRVVVASSDKAYGAHDSLPYREDFALQATAPYEASKAATDIIARSYFHSFGLPVAVTRFANIYGGGDLNFSRLVPEAVARRSRGAGRFCAPTARRCATSSTSRTRPPPTSRSPTGSTATTSAARRSTPAAGLRTASATSSR